MPETPSATVALVKARAYCARQERCQQEVRYASTGSGRAREAFTKRWRSTLRHHPSNFPSSATNGGTYFCVMRQSVSSSTRR